MLLKNISKLALLSAFVLTGAACSGQTEASVAASTEKSNAKAYQSPPKMGAAVTVTSNYDGKTDLGEIENIQFEIRDNYSSGTLTLQIMDSEGLDIISNGREFTYQMNGSEPHILNLQVRARKEGNLSVNFYALANVAPGQTLGTGASTPIYVGDDAGPLKRPQAVIQSEKTSAPGIISMPAQEEIK